MYERVVWVLGAGFSKPLGGPLLPDLLSTASWNKIKATFPQSGWEEGGVERFVLRLYEQHLAKAGGPGRWADAEAFLTFLDEAADGHGPRRAEFEALAAQAAGAAPPLLGRAARNVAAAAKRLVAAECAAFLVDATLDSEPWQPYRAWAAVLEPRHTVITFNYDLVLEHLASHVNGSRIHVVLPGEEEIAATGKVVPVFKLHGSVDWLRVENGSSPSYRGSRLRDEFLRLEGDQLGIASPGPTKLRRTKELAGLWNGAELALRMADAVVFVGYRFPESDAWARDRVLDALAANQGSYLAIHTVLGTNITDGHSARLQALLLGAMRRARRVVAHPNHELNRWDPRGFNLIQHPQYAQDFIGRTSQGELTQAFLHWP